MSRIRSACAEMLGTAMLLTAIVGSGIMGERLAGGNGAIALLANTIATGSALIVIIQLFAPVSGAHLNPAVTLMLLARRVVTPATAFAFVAAQCVGAILGVWIAHAMFAEPVLQVSTHARDGLPQAFAECVATFGLIGTIIGLERHGGVARPGLIGLYIMAAYWFTASTSFANPAVTIARSLTDSFAGIAPHSVPLFLCGQALGAGAALLLFPWLFDERATA